MMNMNLNGFLYLLSPFFLLYCLVGHAENAENFDERLSLIEELSSQIDRCESNNVHSLTLFNKRAIQYFFLGKFQSAIEDFTQIIEYLDSTKKENRALFATALWGRLLCYAYLDSVHEVYNDLHTIYENYISDDFRCNHCSTIQTHQYYYLYSNKMKNWEFDKEVPSHFKIRRAALFVDTKRGVAENAKEKPRRSKTNSSFCLSIVADFANPKEKLTPEQCKERVFGVAQAMRALTLGIPNRKVAAAINLCIAQLEHKANQCCEREHWTECLNPIVDAWEYLKKSMEDGVKVAPYVLLPPI